MSVKPYLILMRPANIVTAIADIWAGLAISGVLLYQLSDENSLFSVLTLTLATVGLYGGGVVFNDYFDAELDAKERPERPIPSGKVSKGQAFVWGSSLLLMGIFASFYVSSVSGILAVGISFFALFYDRIAKHHTVAGPFFMGMCRSLNLMLGMSISFTVLEQHWYMGILPLVFIAAITLTSQGEVTGSSRSKLIFAALLQTSLLVFLTILAIQGIINPLTLAPFAILWAFMNGKAMAKALKNNTPGNIMNAVKTGVISLIPLNASYAAGYGGFIAGLIVLTLLPVSFYLAKKFAVT